MILICESCDRGYPTTFDTCIWCGAGSHVAHTSNQHSMVDTECYVDYFLVRFSTGETFQLFDGHPLDIYGLMTALSQYTIVTFNGINYDMPMLALAVNGATNSGLKQASDMLIVGNAKWWNLLQMAGVEPLRWVDHIDMINVAPGDGGLKAYGGKMHTKKLQDLPIDPSSRIAWFDRVLLREYCSNDVAVTEELFNTFQAQLKLREEMSAEYGIDLRSKSDAQIAEAVMKQLLPNPVYPPSIPGGTQFYYRPPSWVRFINLDILSKLTYPFSINDKGGISPHESMAFIDWGKDQVRLTDGGYISKPEGWKFEPLRIGNTYYAMGMGGLHSMENKVSHYADENYVLRDHDVAGYYPHLIVRLGIYPYQIGPIFQEIYAGWRTKRLAAKHAGDKKTANSLKTLNNGTFGKLNSKFSIFYAPTELLQVTITGQLALLMLIEMLEQCGIQVISANTDGIVIRPHKALEILADQVIAEWEQLTEFETERTDYSSIHSRDVNSYVAIKTDGDIKLKGEFAPAEPGASGWPNPTGQVCVDALVAYISKRIPFEATIRACKDIRQFVYVRTVKGGGVFVQDVVLPKKASKRFKIETAGSIEEYDQLAAIPPRSNYLGKVVRWYYAKGSVATIRYAESGNLVPRSEGCAPLMELPYELPDNIDYDWYVTECYKLLEEVGISLSQ